MIGKVAARSEHFEPVTAGADATGDLANSADSKENLSCRGRDLNPHVLAHGGF